jgi:hypothetical protein
VKVSLKLDNESPSGILFRQILILRCFKYFSGGVEDGRTANGVAKLKERPSDARDVGLRAVM